MQQHSCCRFPLVNTMGPPSCRGLVLGFCTNTQKCETSKPWTWHNIGTLRKRQSGWMMGWLAAVMLTAAKASLGWRSHQLRGWEAESLQLHTKHFKGQCWRQEGRKEVGELNPQIHMDMKGHYISLLFRMLVSKTVYAMNLFSYEPLPRF